MYIYIYIYIYELINTIQYIISNNKSILNGKKEIHALLFI